MCVCVCVRVVWLCVVFYLKNLYVTFYKIYSFIKKKKKKMERFSPWLYCSKCVQFFCYAFDNNLGGSINAFK